MATKPKPAKPRRKRRVKVPVKPWWHSRTIWTAILTVAAGIFMLIADSAFHLGIPDTVQAWIIVTIGAINLILRTVTTLPVGMHTGETKALKVRSVRDQD